MSHHFLPQPDHVSDLLTGYINGALDQESRDRVHTHLGSCEICRDELAEWEDIASATRTFATTLFTPATQGSASVRSVSETSERHPGQDRDAREHATVRRPASNRTLRAAQEKTSMQPALSVPNRGTTRYQIPRRYAALAAVIAILLGLGGVALMNGPGGRDDAVRLPVAMQVNPEASAVAQCEPSAVGIERVSATGTTEHESLIQLPSGPYEGVPGIEASMLPAGGEPVDSETVDDISQTLEGVVACINADTAEGGFVWASEDYWKRRNALGPDVIPKEPREFRPMMYMPGEDTVVPEIEDARVFPDGRVGAVIRPGFDAPAYSYDYFVFVQQGGQWLIDEAVHVTEWVEVELVVTDEGFTLEEVVAPFAPSRLVVRNEGTTTHSVVIPKLGMRVEVAPGETGPVPHQAGNIKHPPGRFDFHSDMPGDDPSVFSGTLVIEGEPQATPEPAAELPETLTQDMFGVPVASTTITLLPPVEYEPNKVAILANRDVDITLVNDPSVSTQGADFLTPVSGEPLTGSPANFTIDALDISVNLEPGESTTITLNAPPGVYAFYSTIPGHTEVGMTGTLHIYEMATPAP
jgi:hypothetical protein